MKAVLISIRPKWCELIASGKKTVEVRKTRPKLESQTRNMGGQRLCTGVLSLLSLLRDLGKTIRLLPTLWDENEHKNG